jgi:hypothetical protein
VGDLVNKVIEAQARREGVAVEDLRAAMVRRIEANPDLISEFVKSVIDSDDSTERTDKPDDTSEYGTGSMSVVTDRTA